MTRERAIDLKASMELNVITVVVVLGGLWDVETEAVTVKEEEGHNIEIQCSHSNAITNGKYFCKGDCNYEDVLIHTEDKVTNEKYRIRDEGNTFYVTIFDLTIDDTGIYWCGIDRVGRDTFTQVDLTVTKQESPSDASTSITPSSMKLLYVAASLGVVMMALVIGLIIFRKHQNRDRDSKSTGQDPNLIYAIPSKHRQNAARDTSAATVTENVERDCEPNTISEDSLFYSSVNFNKHTDCSAVATHTPTVTYSVMKFKPTDETTVYCNV